MGYESTTADFKGRINRDRLAKLADQYAAYANLPKDRSRGSRGSFGPGGDRGATQSQFLTEYEYAEVQKGKIVQRRFPRTENNQRF